MPLGKKTSLPMQVESLFVAELTTAAISYDHT